MNLTTHSSDKKILLAVLTIGSVKELIKHRSFLALIFIILAADKILHRFFDFKALKTHLSTHDLILRLPEILFNELPSLAAHWLFSPLAVLVLCGLFLFKQIVSLWPSNSLRSWHNNNHNAGLFKSLLGLKLHQLFWDFSALGILASVALAWSGSWYFLCYLGWSISGSALTAWVVVIAVLTVWPILMAGLSYSSKLAVLHRGTFSQKYSLYLKLFTSRRIFVGSWLFYAIRILVEVAFIAVIPLGAILYIDHPVIRIVLLCLSITPTYSYLKMASFKFFLFIYRSEPLIEEEFKDYYQIFRVQNEDKDNRQNALRSELVVDEST